MLKKLSNASEMRIYSQITAVADRYGASVYQKVRVADVIDISKLERPQGTYALQAHFDFVVADDSQRPLFAVEFDGPGHSSTNDLRKDEICRQAGLALFRVGLQSSRVDAPRLTFVGYLVHLWFLGIAFSEMQQAGKLPPDEPFCISGFLRPDAKNIFDSEFDLLGPARGKFNAYCKKHGLPRGPLWHLGVAEILLSNDGDGFAAFASFNTGNARVYGRSTLDLKIPSMGALADLSFARHEIGQFCSTLALDDLIEEMKLLAEAGHVVRSREAVISEFAAMKARGFHPLLGSGSDEDFAASWGAR